MKIDSISNPGYTQEIGSSGRGANVRQVAQNQNQRTQMNTVSPDNGLSGAERAFFAKLFPGSSVQSNPPKTYSATGFNASVNLGQIVNRKG